MGWRCVFLVNLAIGLAALVPARRLLRESREERRGPLPDWVGAVLLVAGVGLVSLAILAAPTGGDALAPFHDAWRLEGLAGLVAGGLALGLGRVEARDPEAATAGAVAAEA